MWGEVVYSKSFVLSLTIYNLCWWGICYSCAEYSMRCNSFNIFRLLMHFIPCYIAVIYFYLLFFYLFICMLYRYSGISGSLSWIIVADFLFPLNILEIFTRFLILTLLHCFDTHSVALFAVFQNKYRVQF